MAIRQACERETGMNPDLSRAEWIEETDADVIILAGDIDKGKHAAYWAMREACVLSKPMNGKHVALWVCGHTHACLDTQVNGTRLVSNQKGHPNERVAGFDPGLVISI